ncbi:fatty acid desaturase-domain-containing protein [Armillaria luteobubalina]|uniref:Fatty acid desaturase-domain-containing protein n=1 Tax=Armillaria luteobubalina TaxID=153913 RepID=A0AA39PTS6_9AGAR|nr:fatty acid desaturase-domain-containing protein [Armillaria luteobubalina]
MSETKQTTAYNEKDLPSYTPMAWSLKEIRNAIPSHLFVRRLHLSALYLARDVLLAITLGLFATLIDPYFEGLATSQVFSSWNREILRFTVWVIYWWYQGLVLTGIWVIGHECGHGAFSNYGMLNDILGFLIHSSLFTPYFSWKISHHRHHANHASMENDEVYIPKTRSDLSIPDEQPNETIDYEEIFSDTPIYTLFMLLRQQFFAFPAYLFYNVSGQKHYPKRTNHFDPSSIIFTRSQRNVVILSNIGMVSMVFITTSICAKYGLWNVWRYYGIPWLEVNHWFVMITYLHHTDPVLPHYRKNKWNFPRGAAATVDRDFLGWHGRFFFHDVAHFHVIHHFFPKMPFYNGEEATRYLKAFIGEHYNFSDKPVFRTLWDNYNNCQFVDNDGDILFYRNKQGRAVRRSGYR